MRLSSNLPAKRYRAGCTIFPARLVAARQPNSAGVHLLMKRYRAGYVLVIPPFLNDDGGQWRDVFCAWLALLF
jgi:hypothetical protein